MCIWREGASLIRGLQAPGSISPYNSRARTHSRSYVHAEMLAAEQQRERVRERQCADCKWAWGECKRQTDGVSGRGKALRGGNRIHVRSPLGRS